MEPPSAFAPRWCVPWMGILLAVSLLTFWNPPAIVQLTLESLPSNAAEGKDVLLLVHNLPVDLTGYSWYKGASVDPNRLIASYVIDSQENNPGPGYSARETIYPNGSLLFQNVTLKDTGYYTLQIIKKNLLNEEVTGQFCVYVSHVTYRNPPAIAQLTLESLPSSVAEGKDVLLLVHNLPVDITGYAWYKGASVDSNRLIASYAIDNQENNPGPAHSDRETIYPNGSLLFQNVTLEDTGYYTLQAIKKNLLNEEVTAQLCVYLPAKVSPIRMDVQAERKSTGHPVGTISGIVIGVLVGLLLQASLVYFLFLRNTRRASGQPDLREHPPPASNPGHGLSGTSASLAPLSGPRTEVPIYLELLNPDTNIYCQIHPKAGVAP